MVEESEKLPENEVKKFPDDFVFGVGASSDQNEGNRDRTRHNDWDGYFARHPEKNLVQPGEIGPDWWTPGQAEQDFERIANLGIEAQRFGVEWARIQPEPGVISQEALKRYRNMVDFLKEKGIDPMITLNHFTLPDWIAKQGGWANKSTVDAFRYYSEVMADTFGDVARWITINEPGNVVSLGYLTGDWPPEKKLSPKAFLAQNNIVRANSAAYDVLKRQIPESQVGMTNYVMWYKPEDPNSRMDRFVAEKANSFFNDSFPNKTQDDTDFLGVDFYTGFLMKFNPTSFGVSMRDDAQGVVKNIPFGETVRPEPADYQSDMGWPIVPDYFLEALQHMHNTFHKPVVITENGLADRDDNFRAFYILTHLAALHEAIESGVDIKGYYHWTTVDNKELMEGFKYNFGLIGLDARTQERTIRQSAKMYGEIAQSHEIDVNKLAQEYLTEEQRARAEQIIEGFKTTL